MNNIIALNINKEMRRKKERGEGEKNGKYPFSMVFYGSIWTT